MRPLYSVVLGLVLAASAVAQTPAPGPAVPAAHGDNYYAAGNHVTITEPMGRDVVVAGRQVEILQPVGGDVLAAGWRVSLTGRAEDDVRIVAGEITVNGPVAGDLTVAGGDVQLGRDSHVSGRSWLTGQTITVDGVLEREVHIAGADVKIAGEIRQPVEVIADKLEVLPSARVLAPLRYKAPVEARIPSEAVVTGPITFDRIDDAEARRARAWPGASTLLFSIHLFLAGLLVLAFAPRLEASIVTTLRSRPGRSLLAGFVLLVTVPVAALVLVASIMGLPLGLTLGALYTVALFVALLVTAFWVGDFEAALFRFGPVLTRGQQVLLLLAGVLTLAVLRSMFGGFVVFVSILFGLGALALWTWDAYSRFTRAQAGLA